MAETQKSPASIQQQMLAARVEWEINKMIFPHLKRQVDHRYPFSSVNEMESKCLCDQLEAIASINVIDSAISEMQPEYREAFRYIAFREMGNVITAFLDLAEQQAKKFPRGVKSAENER
jgi:hypothetical protein